MIWLWLFFHTVPMPLLPPSPFEMRLFGRQCDDTTILRCSEAYGDHVGRVFPYTRTFDPDGWLLRQDWQQHWDEHFEPRREP